MVENLVAKRAECEFKPMEGIEGNEQQMIDFLKIRQYNQKS